MALPMLNHAGGRDIDGTTRGLGGSCGLPVTSCGEENLTMMSDTRYPMENILVHEMGHTVRGGTWGVPGHMVRMCGA